MAKLVAPLTVNRDELSEVDKLFPFHFIVDCEMHVTKVGNSLKKIIPYFNKQRRNFTEHFRVLKAGIDDSLGFDQLRNLCGHFVVIEMKNNKDALLKGQFEFRKGHNEIIFFGSLRVEDQKTLKVLGLSYSDFPAHDALFDLHQIKAALKLGQESRLQAEEEQRDSIGRDLHDGVGQMLAYVSIYFNVLMEKDCIEKSDIEKAQKTIRRTIDEVRRLSRNLVTPAIKEIGFKEAVIELINSYAILSRPTFNLTIYKGNDPDCFQEKHKLMLFRFIQELSSNTFKYANANKVDIHIENQKNGIRLNYRDDGIGFEKNNVKKGLGINGILSRVELYGGSVFWDSIPNEGTEVTIYLPFEKHDEEEN